MPLKKLPKMSARFWNLSGSSQPEFAAVEYEDFHFEPHFHDHYVLMLVEKGVNLGQCQHEKYEVLPGEMLFLQPGALHTGFSFECKSLLYLAFYPTVEQVRQYLEKMERPVDSFDHLPLKTTFPAPGQRFKSLFRTLDEKRPTELQTQILMFDFIESLLDLNVHPIKQQLTPVNDPEKFIKAKDFIQAHFSESFNLDTLASACNTSPFHLIKIFKKHGGITPYAYLRSVRVEKAKQLMGQHLSLTEVAYQTGFYDQSHFIRSFKSHTGFSPSAFRAS